MGNKTKRLYFPSSMLHFVSAIFILGAWQSVFIPWPAFRAAYRQHPSMCIIVLLITFEGTVACGCGIIAKSLECLFIPLKVNLAADHRTLHWFALLVVSSPQVCFLIQGDALDCDAWGSEKLTIFPVGNNSLVSVWSCVPVLGGDEVERNDRSSGEDKHCTWVISVYSEGNNHFPSVREAFELQKKKCWVWLAGKPMALLGSGPGCSAGRAHSRLKVLRLH